MMELGFIERALQNFSDVWKISNVDQLAALDVPHSMLGRRRSLLKADVNWQWARWFVESLADPYRIASEKVSYPHLFQEVLNAVEYTYSNDKTINEKQQIASIAAKIILDLSKRIAPNRRRQTLTKAERLLLLDIAGSPARCWICGAVFKDQAIENFLYGQKVKIELPLLIDVLKPRGIIERDLAIEIDHIIPFSKGGNDGSNLELACGWCNRHKSAYISIYDVEGQPRLAGWNSLGLTTLPQRFWIVRLLALRRSCEHPNGCNRSVGNNELTVVGIRKSGALNPSNIRITCYEHDPMAKYRLQPPSLVKKIWEF